ncbi:MAG: hypothetical protein R3249_08630 [Nitriliruptorales bacterium]|nr:hypothetical protein [Nitriliruptorales bacterium]
MSLDVRGEIIKLARELAVEPGDLAFLEGADRDDVRRLRVALEDALDQRNRGIYRRIEASSRLLPPGVAVKIATASFPPLIIGRVSEEIPSDRSPKFLEHMPIEKTGEILPHMNPRRMSDTVRALPVSQMAPMIKELERREEFVTMGRFLAVLTDEQIPAVLAEIEDGRTLLLAGFHTEDPERLDAFVKVMTDEQLVSIRDAASDQGLDDELAVVLANLPPATRARAEAAGMG